MSELPARLKAMRDLRGLTQRQLAKKMNVSPSTIALYETGDRNPDPQMLKRLADCLDCSVDYLLGRTEHKAPNTNKPGSSEVIAAHRADDPMNDLPEEAQRILDEFKEYILKKYGKK
jgi:transcriptional regulator with XRE-family HTH domain